MANPRKPTALKILQGTAQPCRMLKDEPKPPVAMPNPPAHLSAEVKKEWDRVCRSLYDMGLLSEHDGAAIEMYCESYATMVQAQAGIKKSGLLIKGSNGVPRANPLVAIANESQRNAMRILVEFGLTPAARTRVSANTESKKPDPKGKARFFA